MQEKKKGQAHVDPNSITATLLNLRDNGPSSGLATSHQNMNQQTGKYRCSLYGIMAGAQYWAGTNLHNSKCPKTIVLGNDDKKIVCVTFNVANIKYNAREVDKLNDIVSQLRANPFQGSAEAEYLCPRYLATTWKESSVNIWFTGCRTLRQYFMAKCSMTNTAGLKYLR